MNWTRFGNTVLDLNEVAHAVYYDQGARQDDQLFFMLRGSAGGWTNQGESCFPLWQSILKLADLSDKPPPDKPAPSPLPVGSYRDAGDGVIVRRPDTATALVIYGENKSSFLVEWTSDVPVNIFGLGFDPRKKWAATLDGSPMPVDPNNVGYWQGWAKVGPHVLKISQYS
jgi:hypothetical protein